MIIDCQESKQPMYKNCWWLGPYIPDTPSAKPFPVAKIRQRLEQLIAVGYPGKEKK